MEFDAFGLSRPIARIVLLLLGNTWLLQAWKRSQENIKMADRSSRQGSSSISTLFLLYFLQGLPYGFQVNLLPLLLRQNQFSLTRIGFTRMLSLPWILKFTVAPFVDKSAFLHRWIGASLAGMSALYLFSAVAGSSDVLTLLCCVFGLNVLSATQDVAVDALAIQLLKCGELGESERIFDQTRSGLMNVSKSKTLWLPGFWTDGWMTGWTEEGWLNGWMADGRFDGWMDGLMHGWVGE